jgi:hypothetical protein
VNPHAPEVQEALMRQKRPIDLNDSDDNSSFENSDDEKDTDEDKEQPDDDDTEPEPEPEPPPSVVPHPRSSRINPQPISHTFAASAATEQEEQIAKTGVHPDGSKSISVAKRPWRPQVKSTYKEVELEIDPSENLDWLFEEHGKAMLKTTKPLPPRTDEIHYDAAKHEEKFNANIQWRDCPAQHRPIIEALIKEYWDVYCATGMENPIQGFEFTIDTGTSKPICCKVPRYGPHESRVMDRLVKMLESKGLVENDEGPYGAIIVLASKPNQGHIHWSQFIFRLCISYRALNAFTRPFIFPVS